MAASGDMIRKAMFGAVALLTACGMADAAPAERLVIAAGGTPDAPRVYDGGGIRFFGDNIQILDNTVSGTSNDDGRHADCMQTYSDDSPPSQHVRIEGNFCETLEAAQTLMFEDVQDTTIVDNDFAGPTHHAIGLAIGSTGAYVSGNKVNPKTRYEVGIDDSSLAGYEGPEPGGEP